MAKMKNNDSCNSCLFFVSGERMGICKRYPSAVNKSNEDWCGEYRLEESEALDRMVEEMTMPVELRFVETKKQRGRPKKA
jgi:hypothetical protein